MERGIPQRTFENLPNVKNGYYLVSGVFSKPNKLAKQVKKLTKKGFDSGYFKNEESGLHYLYVNRHNAWENAIKDHQTKFDNKFKDEVWILYITNSLPVEEVASAKAVAEINKQKQQKVSRYTNASSSAKLIKRADEYFDKMWYAEAAELYEQALQDKSNYSFEVLEKAGDSHYFNTNMEQAYKWYTILYEEYEDEMSADNIFKYAHSLKGNGKYNRSKRLMRLYNIKVKNHIEPSSFVRKNEVVLDEILNSAKNFEIQNHCCPVKI